MDQVLNVISSYSNYIIIGMIGINLLFLLLIITLFIKNRRLKKKYDYFMRGQETDIETLLSECIEKTDLTQRSYYKTQNTLKQMQKQLQTSIQKVGIVEYSALENTGAELSFALALLNQDNNGIIINVMYTREGSYTYGKEITSGITNKSLTNEELEAINKAKRVNL